MINDKDTQEGPVGNLDAEREELQQATQQFIRSLFRTGMSLALLPVNMLPQEPREHFKSAGREFTRGLTTLVREFADNLEKVSQENEEQMDKVERKEDEDTTHPKIV